MGRVGGISFPQSMCHIIVKSIILFDFLGYIRTTLECLRCTSYIGCELEFSVRMEIFKADLRSKGMPIGLKGPIEKSLRRRVLHPSSFTKPGIWWVQGEKRNCGQDFWNVRNRNWVPAERPPKAKGKPNCMKYA